MKSWNASISCFGLFFELFDVICELHNSVLYSLVTDLGEILIIYVAQIMNFTQQFMKLVFLRGLRIVLNYCHVVLAEDFWLNTNLINLLLKKV